MKKVDKTIFVISLLYLVVPIILQLFFWYNRLISLPLIFLLITATVIVIKKYKPCNSLVCKKMYDKKKIIIFVILIIILNLLSGAGGLFPQNWDYHGRNAIFLKL